MEIDLQDLKTQVRAHWEREACGTRYGESASRAAYFDEITRARYTLEPYILEFADFPGARGCRVLEIGVGAGTDFCNWIRHGAIPTGIDLTERAIALTRERLELEQIPSAQYTLRVADAEALPFDDNAFDMVYSWGVLHHSPDTEQAFREAFRVLRPNGILKTMIYHVPSWTGWMLWFQHALCAVKPFQSVKDVMFKWLESPGTKAYTIAEAKLMLQCVGFKYVKTFTKLGPGDLLLIKPGSKYQHPIFKYIWEIYPRWLIRKIGDRFGLFLMIEAIKPETQKRLNKL